MPRITSEDDWGYSEKKKKISAPKIDVPINWKKVLIILGTILLLAAGGLAAFTYKDTILGMFDRPDTVTSREDAQGSGDPAPEDTPDDVPPPAPKAPKMDGNTVFAAAEKAYATGAINTQGETKMGDEVIKFNTTWTPDRKNGSGTLTFRGKTAQTFLVNELLIVHNESGVVADIIGRPVPINQWVIVNSESEMHATYPPVKIMQGIVNERNIVENGPDITAGKFSVTLNENKDTATRLANEFGSWGIISANASDIKMPTPENKIEGKIEKAPDGSWKVFRFEG